MNAMIMKETKLWEVPMATLDWKAEMKIGSERFVVSPFFQVPLSLLHTAWFSSDNPQVISPCSNELPAALRQSSG